MLFGDDASNSRHSYGTAVSLSLAAAEAQEIEERAGERARKVADVRDAGDVLAADVGGVVEPRREDLDDDRQAHIAVEHQDAVRERHAERREHARARAAAAEARHLCVRHLLLLPLARRPCCRTSAF